MRPRFRLDLVSVKFPHRSCLSEQTSISLVSPDTRSLPQHQKQDGIDRELNMQEQRDRRGGSQQLDRRLRDGGRRFNSYARLEKILWGLRNLTMVGDNAWENYIRYAKLQSLYMMCTHVCNKTAITHLRSVCNRYIVDYTHCNDDLLHMCKVDNSHSV